jgi:hypothetical protein
MMFPLVGDLAVDRIPVAVTCRVLGFSKQAFYQWKANPVGQRDWDDAHLINAAVDIHHDDPASPERGCGAPALDVATGDRLGGMPHNVLNVRVRDTTP